ncbi:UPF0158 family protein [Sorangium sp. So ce185]|uniref:UPF0158 family protein n=1 Tax=Sorangium sp. So ce185 TaxID=3133287 RepID=UPI003F62BBB9
MSTTTTESAAAGRRVPVDWSALASAFDNTAQHIRYFLHLETGALIRLVDGLADPDTRVRVEADPACVRVEAIAARDQYRWLQAFIPTVDEIELQALLLQCLQGPGSFRRFKAVLSGRPDQLRRWRAFRMERIHAAILQWFEARGLIPASFERAWPGAGSEPMRSRDVDSARQQLHAVTSDLAPGDLHAVTALAEFLRATRSGLHTPVVSSRRGAGRPGGLGPPRRAMQTRG